MRSVVPQSANNHYIGKTLGNIIDARDCNDLSPVFQVNNAAISSVMRANTPFLNISPFDADPASQFEDVCESHS